MEELQEREEAREKETNKARDRQEDRPYMQTDRWIGKQANRQVDGQHSDIP